MGTVCHEMGRRGALETGFESKGVTCAPHILFWIRKKKVVTFVNDNFF